MKRAGQMVVTPFPHTDLSVAKLHPVLLLRPASTRFDDWLVCMVSSQLQQIEAGLDVLLTPGDPDFASSGLKAPSVLRLSRLAVLDGASLIGCIGNIGDAQLTSLRRRLAAWISG